MAGKGRNKSKRKASDSSINNDSESKSGRFTKTPENVGVSNILRETNLILHDDTILDLNELFNSINDDTTNSQSTYNLDIVNTPNDSIMNSDSTSSPTNADIMKFLVRIENRLGLVEEKLCALKSLEAKVDKFEQDLSKLHLLIHDENVKTANRLNIVEEKIESTDFNLGVMSSKVHELERNNKQMKDDLTYMQSQSMRNNLVFGNIDEAQVGVSELTEDVLRDFLTNRMNFASDLVKELKFERVHRMGERRVNKTRPIVAKFNLFKEREMVRKSGSALKGTKYYIHEQFPKEVSDKRRKLVPLMKEARRKGSRSWISYDTLYVDGKPVSVNID